MKKYILTLIIAVLAVGMVSAQPRPKSQYYTLGWNIGIPLSSFSDYISAVSVNGGAVQAHIFVTDNIAVGALFGWNTYYQEIDRDTYTLKPGLIATASQFRYVNAMPMKISGNYFFAKGRRFEPYIGAGIGAVYMTEHSLVQDIDFWNSQWGFLASPEIGTFINLGPSFGANISMAYNISTNNFSYSQEKVNNVQSLVFNIGLTYMIK